MSTIQNLKNFIRHGKQARGSHAHHGDPTTNVSNVHAQQQPAAKYAPQPAPQHVGVSEPNLPDLDKVPGGQQHHDHGQAGGFSEDPRNNAGKAARAGEVAARAAGDRHKEDAAKAERKGDYDPSVLERIVAEEREAKGKMPRYPGLERYELQEKMGDGAFSNVYRAKDTTGEYSEVAIKVVRKFEMNATQGDDVLHPDYRKKEPKTVERANILKEVQIMRKIDHKNIIRLVDFSESRQYYYIILELCPGGELFHQIVRLTYFSEDLSRHVIIQVAKALEYLHEEAGVVHRDIKPENLLFYPTPFIASKNPHPKPTDEEDKADEGEFIPGVGAGGIGIIKIADFGLSKVIWDSQTMTPCGTVGYTAPEIVKDERYSKSVDMWALGCVLYTLLCGFPPFYDESIQVLTEKVARGQYTFLSPWWDEISKSAQDLVSHLLTVDPDKRYTIKQFLDHPWIRESLEETMGAEDAPPIATPLRQREAVLQPKVVDQAPHDNLNAAQSLLNETPGSRRMDFRSPGAINLREVFDVGYAVHRQEEETKRRKNFPQGYRGAANGLTSLNSLDEDGSEDYDDEYNQQGVPYNPARENPPAKLPKSQAADVSDMEKKMRSTTLSAAAQARGQQYSQDQQQRGRERERERGYGQHSPTVAAAARKQVKNQGPFELSLDNATLLGRRGKKGPSGLREQVVQ